MKRVAVGVGLFALALGAFVVFYILVPAGFFKTIQPHFSGTKLSIELPIPGPEDIFLDRETNQLIISVEDRRKNLLNPGSSRGGLYALDMATLQLTELTTQALPDFHPHGISFWRTDSGQKFLFVINHLSEQRHVVERFEWKADSLIHLESIQDSTLMTHPNDLVAVGERSFYVTNDHYYLKGFNRTLEEYLQRKVSYVNYYDGAGFKVVARDIGYANGINTSPDGETVFVSSTTGFSILVYAKNSDGSLQQTDEIKLDTTPDNIDLDEQGNLLIACHPQVLKFVSHAKDAKSLSPSQVLKIKYRGVGDHSIEEIFLNDGDYSASSTAILSKDQLIIGSVFEKSILLCTLEN